MAERVLITGGAGFVGLHLARRLLNDGADVTVLDDFSRGRRDRVLDELVSDLRIVTHDLTSPIPDGLLTGEFDAVYHLAAVVGVQRVDSSPARVLRTNTLSTLHLLDWCDLIPPGALFLSSTSEVGDGAAAVGLTGHPTHEDVPFVLAEPRRPRSSYALSKMVAESLVHLRRDSVRVRIGRYYNVYGPRMGTSHVIPQFIRRIAAGEDPFAIYGAYQSRAFCHVDDAVEATVDVTRLPTDEALVVNIGNDQEEIRILDLARRLFALTGRSPDLAIFNPPDGSPERRLPDLRRLRSLLPARRPVDLDTGLRTMLDWYGAEAAARPGAS
ncbi:UDP-glucose 4-epimerase/UDP-glucuronate decarboxylase [Sinosporangium album]|uniref:UDP-glucose 4-epimerase/UDP-glucuronate decarboxylase n=1 Tax=Sinosporangium album TaxID=504805 RepID=A0A1G8A6R2_9ACTN|nr:NAD-dependent epimerase/dehydratase family protein [Sinosporangium album]SDH16665.1 UDP-glucose 4-epimerase/UDP-glucuronate decarboxylase [Sinosporangium album]